MPSNRFEVGYWHLRCVAQLWIILWAVLLKKKKHVYRIRSDHLHSQGKCGGYSKGTALMDSAHFLLLCNGDHPVRAGARADGGFVCVWIRIGEVLFYSFSVTAQEKGKRRWDGRVQTGWRWKPRLTHALFHSVIKGIKSVKVNAPFACWYIHAFAPKGIHMVIHSSRTRTGNFCPFCRIDYMH